jgi:hypothetical protein
LVALDPAEKIAADVCPRLSSLRCKMRTLFVNRRTFNFSRQIPVFKLNHTLGCDARLHKGGSVCFVPECNDASPDKRGGLAQNHASQRSEAAYIKPLAVLPWLLNC